MRGAINLIILICDDDEKVLDSLKKMTEEIFKQFTPRKDLDIETFSTTYDLLDYLEEKNKCVDAVILDIELNDENGIDGIELAEKIEKEYSYVKIIFCTGFLKYSEKVFRVNPLYCIYKPITIEKLENVLRKLIKEAEKRKKQYITIKSYKTIHNIMLDNIYYAEINNRHVNIYTDDGVVEAIETMNKLSERLGTGFVKCHKSYIVNIEKMRRFEQDRLILENGTEVVVSRRYKGNVKEKIAEMLD